MAFRISVRADEDLIRVLTALDRAGAAGAPWKLFELKNGERILEVRWKGSNEVSRPSKGEIQSQLEGDQLARIPVLFRLCDPPRVQEAMVLLKDENHLQKAVVDSLSLGSGDLLLSYFVPPGAFDPVQALRIQAPPTYLLNEWAEEGEEIYTPSPSNPMLWLPWGMEHPFSRSIPTRGEMLRGGLWGSLQDLKWKAVYDYIQPIFNVSVLPTESKDPPRIQISVELRQVPQPQNPEAWILQASALPSFESWVKTLGQELEKNLEIALVKEKQESSGGAGWLVLRRTAPGNLPDVPSGSIPLYHIPQHRQMLLPCGFSLFPRLRWDLYTRVLPVPPRHLGILLRRGERYIKLEFPVALFRPLESFVDIVIELHRPEIEELIQESILDLSSYRIAPLSRIPPEEAKKRDGAPAETAPRSNESTSTGKAAGSKKTISPATRMATRVSHGKTRWFARRDKIQPSLQLFLEILQEGGTWSRWNELADLLPVNDFASRFRCRIEALWCDSSDEAIRKILALLNNDQTATGYFSKKVPEIPIFRFSLQAALDPNVLSNPSAVEEHYRQLRDHEESFDLKALWLAWLFFLRHNHDQVEIRHLHERLAARLGRDRRWEDQLPGELQNILQSALANPEALGDTTRDVRSTLHSIEKLIDGMPRTTFQSAIRASLSLTYAQSGLWPDAERALRKALNEVERRFGLFRAVVYRYASIMARFEPLPSIFRARLDKLLSGLESENSQDKDVREQLVLLEKSLETRLREATPARALLSEKYRTYYPSDLYKSAEKEIRRFQKSSPDEVLQAALHHVDGLGQIISQDDFKRFQIYAILANLFHCWLMEARESGASRQLYMRFQRNVIALHPPVYRLYPFNGLLLLLILAEMALDLGYRGEALGYLKTVVDRRVLQSAVYLDALDVISKAAAVVERLPPQERGPAALLSAVKFLLDPKSDAAIHPGSTLKLLKLRIVDQVLVAFVSREKWVSSILDRFIRQDEAQIRKKMLEDLRNYLGKVED